MATSSRLRSVMSYPAIDMIKSSHTVARQFVEINQAAVKVDLLPPATIDLPQIDFPLFTPLVDSEDRLYFIRLLLLSTTSEDEYSKDLALVVYTNILIYYFPSLKSHIVQILKKIQYDVMDDVNFFTWADKTTPFNSIDYTNLEPMISLDINMVMALIGIITCFIGRLLTSGNSYIWLDRRRMAFAQACGTDPEDPAYYLLPSTHYIICIKSLWRNS